MKPTRNTLPAASREQLIPLLNARLADATDLKSQVKQAHWNVKGPQFLPLHELFDGIAGRLDGQIDEIVTNVKEGRPGAKAAAIWTTQGFPISNDAQDDAALVKVGTTLPGGTVFRVVEFSPGVQSRNHRTDSIDYAVVIKGEIDILLSTTIIENGIDISNANPNLWTTGSGYNNAIVTITGDGTNAAARAVLPPINGHGTEAVQELGGIYSGYFSPTEAAAVSVLYVLLVELLIRY